MATRQKDYLDFIRSLSCCVCFKNSPSYPHHTRTRGAGGLDGGCIPLCKEHHAEIHTIGIGRFEEKYHTTIPIEIAKCLHLERFGENLKLPNFTVTQLYEHQDT